MARGKQLSAVLTATRHKKPLLVKKRESVESKASLNYAVEAFFNF